MARTVTDVLTAEEWQSGGAVAPPSPHLFCTVDVVCLQTGEREEGEHVLRLPTATQVERQHHSAGPWAEGLCPNCLGELDLVEVELPSSSWVESRGFVRVFMRWGSCIICCTLVLATPVEEGDLNTYCVYKVAHENAKQDGWRWNRHRTTGAMIG